MKINKTEKKPHIEMRKNLFYIERLRLKVMRKVSNEPM